MPQAHLDITLADGKYRIVQSAESGTVAFRHGEEWLNITTTPGANLILAMAYEIAQLRERRPLTEEQYLLICAMEECAEVTQRISKALRFGLDEVQPGQERTNADRVAEELSDLATVVDLLEQQQSLPLSGISGAKTAKLDKFMAYSREQGTLL